MSWILIDGSWLAYRIRYGNRSQVDLMKDPTGFLFMLFDQIRVLCFDEHLQTNNVAIFLDSKRSKRKEKYKKYKANRSEITSDEIVETIRMKELLIEACTRIFRPIGIKIFHQHGYEADDLIASACKSLDDTDTSGCILTADQDLFQCISKSINWYNPASNKYYTYFDFKRAMNIEPHLWSHVKALSGCSSDNIPGIEGVGEKTAIRYLNDNLPHYYKTYRSIVCDKGVKIFRRNLKFVRLPYPETIRIRLEPVNYSFAGFEQACDCYGFRQMMNDRLRKMWKRILTDKIKIGQFQPSRPRNVNRHI